MTFTEAKRVLAFVRGKHPLHKLDPRFKLKHYAAVEYLRHGLPVTLRVELDYTWKNPWAPSGILNFHTVIADYDQVLSNFRTKQRAC